MSETLIPIPQMLMVGSTGRNKGKTTFAIEGIKYWKDHYPVIALKVTSMDVSDGECPRGWQGCGACSNLCGHFELTEETDRDSPKDTSHLLQSGAQKVYWLRTLRSHHAEGIEAFLKLVPPGALIICESNSLRKVIKPGVFLMLHNENTGLIKASAQEVLAEADRMITRDMRIHSKEVLESLIIEKNEGEISIRLA